MLLMNTVEETRRTRLRVLVEQFGGMANLCEKLGYARTETAALTRILNANVRKERDGKAYEMGSQMARKIEESLGLQSGLMDNPPTYAELDPGDWKMQALFVMEKMAPDLRPAALRLLTALNKPEVVPKSEPPTKIKKHANS
jgi:hypothetical protein